MFCSSSCLLENQYEPFWTQEEYIKIVGTGSMVVLSRDKYATLKALKITEQKINLMDQCYPIKFNF